ncbi:MAG: hypothetical protein VST72_01310 [Nitrospirota bacterium]|nr:hypothetical protein [Nitrospirota bacterium]
MLIITGTGRSGTATMAEIFGGRHEFRVDYILDKYFSKADPHSDLFSTIEERVKAVLDLHQGIDSMTFVDSSNLYIHFIDAVYLLNPSARFVLAVRNGKDFVRSALSRGWHEKRLFGIVPPYNNPCYNKWETMGPLQRNAWIWTCRNRKAVEGLSILPEDRKLIVRIEDIKARETIEMLEDFSGIKIKGGDNKVQVCNANPSFCFPPKEEWTDEQNSEFDAIAGEMMKFFNYA